MKEVHKATVNQKVPALKPATAGVAGRLPVNTLETGYLGRFLQNAKDMYWNSSEVTGNSVLYKKEDLLPTSADIGKSSLLAPGGGLMAHEGKKKGHLIERHIDKTDEQLLQRLKEDKKIPSSSSFKDRAIAERVANIVLNDSKNIDKIQKWLSNPHSRPTLALKYKGDGEIIGRSRARNSELAEDVTKARIVLKKGKNGSFIVTGYPEK
ncbi:RNase A-like domain-containing protein [Priestia filamentosa]|uniref:RNase A-like domain-containing protein n=1 Tax=Priestia filamentosa TaxID=1402861 RepID=UPI003981F321